MAETTPPDAASPVRLQIVEEEDRGTVVLKLSGELDIASAPALEQALQDVEEAGARRLLIDLGELLFMDSTGLRALLLARRQATESERELLLRQGPRQVQRVFELSGTLDRFSFQD